MSAVVRILARRLAPTGPSTIDGWSAAFSTPEPATQGVAETISADVAERFATRTDPWGAAWAPLSPVTIEIRARRGTRDGAGLVGARFVRILDGGRRAAVGLASSVARWQQFGNPANKVFGRGAGPLPARPILPITPGGVEAPDDLLARVKQAFRAGIRAALSARRA